MPKLCNLHLPERLMRKAHDIWGVCEEFNFRDNFVHIEMFDASSGKRGTSAGFSVTRVVGVCKVR